MANLIEGRSYYAVPTGQTINGRRVFVGGCGDDPRVIAVLQGADEYNGRHVFSGCHCFDGQYLGNWQVVAVPQNMPKFNGRRVFAFACCQAGAAAGTGAYGSGAAGAASAAQSGSGPGAYGGAGFASVKCCTNPLPKILYINLSGTGCGIDGTYMLEYYANTNTVCSFLENQAGWLCVPNGCGSYGDCSTLLIWFGCVGGQTNPQFSLIVYLGQQQMYDVNQGVAGTTLICDPFHWYGTLYTGSGAVNCGCGLGTFDLYA